MDDQCAALGPLQSRFGERIGGRHDLAAAVRADVQRRQIAARGMPGVPGDLQMAAGGREVALAFAHGMDVHAVAAGGEDAAAGGFDGDCRVAVREVDRGVRDGPPVGRLQHDVEC
ncbi:hypothetical protein MAUB_38020 [Mycolicibacterium aubagnense]|uniref:Uncharacterized protein n=1 Tax=Mycolicibacterium aubagnense TaxID=319707 RepID=A0ABM7IGU2_9MYCO|nr:hypothetical protein MAUB_38020 [Mycolicibacterium aubagnense]